MTSSRVVNKSNSYLTWSRRMDGQDACKLFRNYTSGDLYLSIIVNIRVSVSCFSFIGSLLVIGLIWLFKKYKFFTQRLILYLSISAFFSSIAYILGRVDYDPDSPSKVQFCVVQGFLLLYTDWTVMMCVFCITFNLVWTVFTTWRPEKLEIVYLVLSYILPFSVCFIPFIQSSFGPSGAWCWIRSQHDNCSEFPFANMLQFVVWYGPLYFIIFLLFLMYIAVILKLRKRVKIWQGTYDPNVEISKTLLKKEIKPLLWYPTIFFAICLFPFINRLAYAIVHKPTFSLYILHVIFSPLLGALTALVYALDRDTLRRLNWSTIKASFRYRSTDEVVREYPVDTAANEDGSETQPFIEESKCHSPTTAPTHTIKKD